jgi:hypothetical protein
MIQYLVHFLGLPPHIPQHVAGRTGKSFGHAVYNAASKHHEIKISEKDWNVHGMDICAGLKRRTARSFVTAESIPDPDSPETIAEEKLDAMAAQLTESRITIQTLLARISELERPAQVEAKALPEQPPAAQQAAEIPTLKEVKEQSTDIDPRKALDEMGYRDMRNLAKLANLPEERIKLVPSPSTETLRASLLALPDLADILKNVA